MEFGDMDWIDLALDRGPWWTLVKAIMNLRVSQLTENLLASQEGLYSMG
jgi:hypothetical protein